MKKIIFLLFIAGYFLYLPKAMGQSKHQTVIAVQGDGVYAILRKSGIDPTKYYKKFVEINKENMNPNGGLYVGRNYYLPSIQDSISPKKTNITIDSLSKKIADSISPKITDSISLPAVSNHPIFGKKYSKVPIKNKKLEGAIYYIISGHGGPDPGAMEKHAKGYISEDEYAYDVSLRLARRLISSGAKVYIIIKDPDDGIRDQRILEMDYDEVNYPEQKISKVQKTRLKQRTKAVNKLFLKHKGAYQRLIVTHVDSRSKSQNIDVFFYHHKNSKSGKRLAQNIQSTFKKKYARHQPNRIYSGTISSRNLYLVKNTLPPMVYVELGNIKNPKDQRRILSYQNRAALSKWLTEGLLLDYKQYKK